MLLQYRTPKTNLFADTARRDSKQGIFAPSSPTDWTAARKARPLNDLLPTTRRWAESLPELDRPTTVMRMYPRIANRIAAAWRDPNVAHAVLDDLLIDRRVSRRGFPPFVLAELLRIREILDGSHSLVLRT